LSILDRRTAAAQGDLLVILPRRLHAPRQDGAVVAEPPLAEAGQLLVNNRRRLAQAAADFLGRPWDELRRQARRSAVAAARDYFRQSAEPTPPWGDTSLVMAGHQPELFHPGVWVKNFALNHFARTQSATPVNLIVDNDTAKATTLRLPSLDGPRVVTIAFDRWQSEIPYEERHVLDEDQFAGLPARAGRVTADWGFEPLLPAFWQEAMRHAGRTRLLGERLVAARRTVERCRSAACVRRSLLPGSSVTCSPTCPAFMLPTTPPCATTAALTTSAAATTRCRTWLAKGSGWRSRCGPGGRTGLGAVGC